MKIKDMNWFIAEIVKATKEDDYYDTQEINGHGMLYTNQPETFQRVVNHFSKKNIKFMAMIDATGLETEFCVRAKVEQTITYADGVMTLTRNK